MTTNPDCPRKPGDAACPFCERACGEPCPMDDVDPALLDPTKAIGAVTPATTCDPDEGVCEACQ